MRAGSSIKIAVGLALSLSLVSCIGAQNIAKDQPLDLSSNKGVVVGTITLKKSTYAAPIFYFTGSGTGAAKTSEGEIKSAISFSENPVTRRPRTDLPQRLAKLFVIELPEGKYTFHELRFPRGAAAGAVWIDMSSTSQHNVSFNVAAGKVVYVGDLYIDAESSNIRGVSVNDIQVRDTWEQDKAEVLKNYPNLQKATVGKSLFQMKH